MSQGFSCKGIAALAVVAGLAASASAQRIFDSGPTCTSLNASTQLPTLVGFSSGNLVSAAAPQRWMAQPFTLASNELITEIGVNGSTPLMRCRTASSGSTP